MEWQDLRSERGRTMIVVKVELHSAITGEVTEIGRMQIINDGTSDRPRTKGNYKVRRMRRGTEQTIQAEGTVLNHPRLSAPVWDLVVKAIKSTFRTSTDKAGTDD